MAEQNDERRPRRPSNPLALAVLGALCQQPMHPYEIASTLREQHKDESIKISYGSLYTVVDRLQRDGLIEALETGQQGRRPQRTVYGITDAGLTCLADWLRELLREPVKGYVQFSAGLANWLLLDPDEALTLLRDREGKVAAEVAAQIERLADYRAHGLPRVVLIESEYELALREAELAWLREVVADLADGSLEGLDTWREARAQALAAHERRKGRRAADADGAA